MIFCGAEKFIILNCGGGHFMGFWVVVGVAITSVGNKFWMVF